MLRGFFRAFLWGEAVVGLTLTLLLLLGRTHPETVFNTTAVVGAGIIIALGASAMTGNPQTDRRQGAVPSVAMSVEATTNETQYRISESASRFGRVLQAIIAATTVIGTGALLYFLS